jgi:hypothetical protein
VREWALCEVAQEYLCLSLNAYSYTMWTEQGEEIWVVLRSSFWHLVEHVNSMNAIRGSCAHAPVWIQLKMLLQRGCFGAVLGRGRPPVFQETICKEATLSPMTWFGYFL